MEEKIMTTKKYDFYIEFYEKDMVYAERIMDLLSENNLTCFYLKQDKEMSGAFIEQSNLSIRNANAIIILITNEYLSSRICYEGLQGIIKIAQGADKEIMPVCLKNTAIAKDNPQINYLMYRFGLTFVDDINFVEEITELIRNYKNKFVKKVLYEKLNSYIASNSNVETYKTIREICAILPREFDLTTRYYNYPDYLEYVSLLKILGRRSNYNESSKDELGAFYRALNAFNVITQIKISKKTLRNIDDILLTNLTIYLYVVIVHFNLKDEYFSDVSHDRADCGRIRDGLPLLNELQEIFNALRNRSNLEKENISLQVKKLIYAVIELLEKSTNDVIYCEHNYYQLLHSTYDSQFGLEEPKEEKDEAAIELEKQLFEVAKHINKSNEIFQRIADKETTHEFLTCLKTSYERLKSYCELVGCKKVANYCIEELSKIDLRLIELKEDEVKEGLKENCFKALLGFTLPTSGRYDVFISYKHEDDDIASNIHAFLKQNLVNAFYDKVTLPKLGKSEYHEAIMDSIDRSDNFIVILSDLRYINADWVKLEMRTFHTEMTEGRKPNANFIMIVTPEVYDEIIKSNKVCLPIDYRRCEIMKTTEYREKLLPYITTIK